MRRSGTQLKLQLYTAYITQIDLIDLVHYLVSLFADLSNTQLGGKKKTVCLLAGIQNADCTHSNDYQIEKFALHFVSKSEIEDFKVAFFRTPVVKLIGTFVLLGLGNIYSEF